MIQTNTPARYSKASLQDSQQTDIVQALRGMFSAEGRKSGKAVGCLLLIGVPGCGKTHAIWGLKNDMDKLQDYIEIEQGGEYHTYRNPGKRRVSVIDASWFSEYPFMPFDAKDEEMRRLKEADVLAIDDLGMEAETEKNTSIVESVINTRYNQCRTTVITTNLSVEDFKRRYGARVADRLREWGTVFESRRGSMRAKLKAAR